ICDSLVASAVILTSSSQLLPPNPGKLHPDKTVRHNTSTIQYCFNFFIMSSSNYLDTFNPLGTAHLSTIESKKSTNKANAVTNTAALIIINGSYKFKPLNTKSPKPPAPTYLAKVAQLIT